MAYTVQASINKFIENISLTGNQSDTAEKRATSIVDLLSKEFNILEAFPMGSLITNTSLKGYADVDIMVALHYGQHIEDKTPTELLQDVRNCLSEYNTKMAKKNGQANTLYFKTWPNVDIVPASKFVNNKVFSHYEIPNINDNSWIRSNPKIHIQKMKKLSSYKLQLIRIVKEWNRKHSSYLSSFHIENIALTYGDVDSDLSWHICKFFDHIFEELKTNMPNPNKLGNNVDDYLDYFSREEAKKRVETAMDLTTSAWYETHSNKNEKLSIEIYSKCFGERFPNYG